MLPAKTLHVFVVQPDYGNSPPPDTMTISVYFGLPKPPPTGVTFQSDLSIDAEKNIEGVAAYAKSLIASLLKLEVNGQQPVVRLVMSAYPEQRHCLLAISLDTATIPLADFEVWHLTNILLAFTGTQEVEIRHHLRPVTHKSASPEEEQRKQDMIAWVCDLTTQHSE